MSPRQKSENSKNRRFEIRLNDDTYKILEECSEKMNITKTDVINNGFTYITIPTT